MYQEFQAAPDSTRTKVGWFHGETETTHEGITADLEAFKEAGVGGVIYYDQIHGGGKRASTIFSPEWWEALRFSAAEAKRITFATTPFVKPGDKLLPAGITKSVKLVIR